MGRRSRDPDPGKPHQFRRIDDPGLGALAAGGGQGTPGASPFTMVMATDNYIRKARCGVPGCGRERSDPIHQRGED
jgi:hypothetical protein